MNIEEAKLLAINLMDEHGLIDEGWYFKFTNSKISFGHCHGLKREIALSMNLVELNSEEKVKDTILHEIAHALVGVRQGHNDIWKAKCIEIGCKPERCYTDSDVQTPKGKYEATCPVCQSKHYLHRLPKLERCCVRCTETRTFDSSRILNFVRIN